MSNITFADLPDVPTVKLSIWQRIFLRLVKCIPTEWLMNALKSRYEIYMIALMNSHGRKIIGGKYDGLVDVEGRLSYCVSSEMLESIFEELDKRMEVQRMIVAAADDA